MPSFQNAVQKIEIQATVVGGDKANQQIDQIDRGFKRLGQSGEIAGRGTAIAEQNVAKMIATVEKNSAMTQRMVIAQRDYAAAIEATGRAANDNSKSIGDVSRSWIDAASNAIEMVSHLKLLALGIYAYSAAARSVVNVGLVRVIGALGPAAVSAGSGIVSALSPALSFLSRMAVPLLGLAVAWEGLTSLWSKGSALLEKYGNAQRSLFASDVGENIEKLTKFQNDAIPIEQVQRATELGARLAEAKNTISDFLRVQVDLTGPALFLQSIWVGIVEAIAKVVEWAGKLPSKLPTGGGADAQTYINSLGGGMPSAPGPAVPTGPEDLTAARKAAVDNLSAGLGSGTIFANRYSNALSDLGKMYDELNKKTDKAAESQKRVSSEFDRLEKSIGRSTAAQEADAEAIGKSVGEHARLRTEFRLQEAALQDIAKNGGNLKDYADRIKTISDREGEAAQKRAQAQASSQAAFEVQIAGLGGVEQSIAQVQYRLHGDDWKNWMNDGVAASMRLADEIKSLKNATDGFGQSLLSGLLSGQGAMKSLMQAGSQMTSQLASATLKRVQNGGSFFGNQDLMSTGGALGIASAGLAGYQSGSPLVGALGGAMAGATFGPVGAVIGGIAGAIGGLLGAGKKAKEAAEQAAAAWKAMESQAKALHTLAVGEQTGAAQAALQQANETYDKLRETASKVAGPMKRVLLDQLDSDIQKVRDHIILSFRASFYQISEAFNSVYGANSPAIGAIAQTQQLVDRVKQFVNDARLMVYDAQAAQAGVGKGGPLGSMLNPVTPEQQAAQIAAAKAVSYGAEEFNRAIDAARNALLNSLGSPEEMTAVQKRILEFTAIAPTMVNALVELGLTMEQANQIVGDKINDQMQILQDKFTDSLVRRRLSAQGLGYINDFNDLRAQHAKDMADARNPYMNIDASLVEATFHAEAQKLADDLGLVGGQFDLLLETFPDLTGVIHQSTQALDDLRNSMAEYLATLTQGDLSPLSPTEKLSAAQSTFNSQLALAQQGDSSATQGITQYATALLTAAREVWASSPVYQQIYSLVTGQLRGLTGMATGGIVGNGIFNRDSVIASYAGGGNIALAGGEYVMPAMRTAQYAPQLEAMRVGKYDNDNGRYFAELSRNVCSSIDAQTTVLAERLANLEAKFSTLTDTIRQKGNEKERGVPRVAARR